VIAWVAAVGLDLLIGEPPAWAHPVVWIGRLIARLEARAPRGPRSQLLYGVGVAAAPAVAAGLLGVGLRRVRPRALRTLLSIWVLKTTFAVRALLDASRSVDEPLVADDLPGARERLGSLVSRDRRSLDRAHIASAAIESVSENLSDSYVAPLFWYLIGGLPAALAYRAINTADAMVGYRGHYEYLGKASARVDDVANYVPARLSGLALVAAAQLEGSNASAAALVMRRDHARTASPNAGWPMAAAAGALGIWLEKIDHYRLGGGRDPAVSDIQTVRELVLLAAGLCTVVAWAARARR
jgi:adenosylcobinamide-phosphate synthase